MGQIKGAGFPMHRALGSYFEAVAPRYGPCIHGLCAGLLNKWNIHASEGYMCDSTEEQGGSIGEGDNV